MKLAAFIADGEEQWGVINEDAQSILSAPQLEEHYFAVLPETLDDLIADEEGLLSLATALQKHAETPTAGSYSLNEIILLPPLRPKKNIFCVGKNYREHVTEFEGNEDALEPEHPIIFSKLPTSVIASGDVIDPHPEATSQADYEGELAIVIGKRGQNISEEDAWEYIFGYTIINDVTARDLQKRHSQWLLGKSLDTFCPMGPYLLVGNHTRQDFEVHTYVNGELRQSGKTEDLIFSFPNLIATISSGITLEPGDIISTGTPKGVGMGFRPPRFLQTDDEISITIPTIGTLTNTVK